MKSWYEDQSLDAEVYNSVACLKLSNPLDINARVEAVNKFTLLPEASDLAAAGRKLQFNCPIDGEYKVGANWKETH